MYYRVEFRINSDMRLVSCYDHFKTFQRAFLRILSARVFLVIIIQAFEVKAARYLFVPTHFSGGRTIC